MIYELKMKGIFFDMNCVVGDRKNMYLVGEGRDRERERFEMKIFIKKKKKKNLEGEK